MKLLRAIRQVLAGMNMGRIEVLTFALVIITFFYLLETRRIRIVAENATLLENMPQVFISTPKSTMKLNSELKRIEVITVFELINSGSSRAENVEANYMLMRDEVVENFRLPIMPLFFSGQRIPIKIGLLGINLNEQQFAATTEAIARQKPLTIPEGTTSPIDLTFRLKYSSSSGETQDMQFKYTYEFYSNSWVISSDEER